MNRRDCLHTLAGLAATAALPAAVRSARAQTPTPPAVKLLPTILPPDANTRTPKFTPPANACDTHCHIFGPNSRYPYVATRSYTPPDAPLEDFRTMHRKIGIDRATIVNPTIHGRDNRVVTDAIAQSNGRYLGIANVDDRTTERELEDLDRAGIRGCRFTFIKRLGPLPKMDEFQRIIARIAPLRWHVDLYVDGNDLDELAPTFSKLPVSYVLDHMAAPDARKGLDQPGFRSLLALMQKDDKCWVKVTGLDRASATGAPFHDAVPFARRIVETAPDRVLWGTDWPHPNVKVMPNDGDVVDLIPLYAPDAAAQQKLLVTNPARLFRFAG